MDIFAAFEQLKAAITELSLKLVDMEASIKEAKDAAYEEGRLKGFEEGVASVPTPGGEDKLYTQADLDAKVAEAIAASEVKVGELEAQVAGHADAIAALKTEFKAIVADQKSVEDASESEMSAKIDAL